ncbi:MAG TPA: glycerophosphodiester phosphodiesterase [Burkholderiaceae bacterium]|nr:glycerophosphodiester phosphodiesterase [Burkholderiaceae bacterium]HQR69085.1 glycerophosphodiester phosphodiesterase [Burkholderiaceae bacterium]
MSHFRPWPWPRVLAHRGAGRLAPENTLAALRVGFERGFRAVEFDAMAPLDDVAVLMHDPTLRRTTGVAGAVTERRADELAQLDAGAWHSPSFAHEPVPTLAQALQYCRTHSVWANVEIKPAPGHEARTGAIVARGVALAYADLMRVGGDRAAALDDRVPLLSSFEEESLVAARAAAADLPRALLIDEVPDDWQLRLERLGAVSLNTNHRHLDEATAGAVKRAGYWLFCYTVNDAARARRLRSWGVDAFCTDRIDRIGPDFAA